MSEYPELETVLLKSLAYKLVDLEECIYNCGSYEKGLDEYIGHHLTQAECDEFEYKLKELGLVRVEGECDTEHDSHGSTQIDGWVVYKTIYGDSVRINFSGDCSWGDGAEFDDYYYVTSVPVVKNVWSKVAV